MQVHPCRVGVAAGVDEEGIPSPAAWAMAMVLPLALMQVEATCLYACFAAACPSLCEPGAG